MTEYLIGLGHRKIAMLAGPEVCPLSSRGCAVSRKP